MEKLDDKVDLVDNGNGTFKFRLRLPEQRITTRVSRGVSDTPRVEELVQPPSVTEWRVASTLDMRGLTVEERYNNVRKGEYKVLEDPKIRTMEHFYCDNTYIYSMNRMLIRIPIQDVNASPSLSVENKLRAYD